MHSTPCHPVYEPRLALCGQVATCTEVFLFDLVALTARSVHPELSRHFDATMTSLLSDPRIVKLGFAFGPDTVALRKACQNMRGFRRIEALLEVCALVGRDSGTAVWHLWPMRLSLGIRLIAMQTRSFTHGTCLIMVRMERVRDMSKSFAMCYKMQGRSRDSRLGDGHHVKSECVLVATL